MEGGNWTVCLVSRQEQIPSGMTSKKNGCREGVSDCFASLHGIFVFG